MVNKVPSMKELMKLYKKANYSNELNESSSREVKVTKAQKKQMLKVAQDLHDIVKTHHGVEGTRLLAGKMQDRDALTRAARILESLAKLN